MGIDLLFLELFADQDQDPNPLQLLPLPRRKRPGALAGAGVYHALGPHDVRADWSRESWQNIGDVDWLDFT